MILTTSLIGLFLMAIPSVQAISIDHDSHHYNMHYRESTEIEERSSNELRRYDNSSQSVRKHHSGYRPSNHCH